MAPKAYRSLRPSRFDWPRACSGLIYCTVPTVNPVAVLAPPASLPPGSRSFAIPKSRSRTRPLFASTITLRSEEHTSELQSHSDLVCRLLLEKKKKKKKNINRIKKRKKKNESKRF